MKSPEQSNIQPGAEAVLKPIHETEDAVAYLGVRLEKAARGSGAFVPKREHYADYNSDQFAQELQKKIATSFLQGDPILLEGGTSIGKTTTVKKMCAELGWEVHYANLNGATDVQDLMGRYIPNPHKVKEGDPEYIFADGKVTSGLRKEEGKTKVIILDEYNASAPNILIRLHEVLDALERGENVVLSEDASEAVSVSKQQTKVIALINPPGKGYFGREPLDPAQLRRWVYQKEATNLPDATFSFSTKALFGMSGNTEETPEELYTKSRLDVLSVAQLQEIPGIEDILAKYEEFHKATKELIAKRKIAADQPQLFTYDDRMEPRRVRNFVLRFYHGDINETFQEALRYYYKNKLESNEDKHKLEELITHVMYKPKEDSRRKGAERQAPTPAAPTPKAEQPVSRAKNRSAKAIKTPELRMPTGEAIPLAEAEILMTLDGKKKENFLGPKEVAECFEVTFAETPPIPFSRTELLEARDRGEMLVLRIDKTNDGRPLSMEAMHKMLTPEWAKQGKGDLFNSAEGWKNVLGDMYEKEAPRPGWALVAKELVPNTTGKNYLDQTEALVNYLQATVFKDEDMPAEYVDALVEFSSNRNRLAELMKTDWEKAAKQLSELEINQLTRQSLYEVMYDLVLQHNAHGKRLLPSTYTWTNSLDSDGLLVVVGGFDEKGVRGGRWPPGSSNGILGVSLSRR